jgi:hypothetical protein
VRVRRLFFAFAIFVANGATPLHAALGVAPRCVSAKSSDDKIRFADAGAPMPKLGPSLSFDAEDRDYIIRTIAFEAGEEPDEGKAAVAHVILNRKRVGRWGDSIKEVVTHPWQFEPWMTKKSQMKNLSREDPRYKDAARVTDAVLAGDMPDPTAGATHFLNPTIVRKRRGGSLPDWASGEGQPIGQHVFYMPAVPERSDDPKELGTGQEAGTLPASAVEDALLLTEKGPRETRSDDEC